MRRSELRALQGDGDDLTSTDDISTEAQARYWWLAAVPVLVLVFVTVAILLWPGMTGRADGAPLNMHTLLQDGDPYASILYGALCSVTAAIVLTVLARRGTLRSCVEAATAGMARVFTAIIVLVLAWAISQAAQDLQVGQVISAWLTESGFSITWLPAAVFVSAAGISFATGTSWGTMGILCPMVVMIAAEQGAQLPADRALILFYGSVGSVLAGAIFGDHCSPISDTTVLSSIASGCSLDEHVNTQMPYALLAAAVELVAGDYLCARFGLPGWVGIGVGIVILVIALRLIGRRPQDRIDGRAPCS